MIKPGEIREEWHMLVAAIDTGGTKIVGSAVTSSGKIMTTIRIENTGRNGAFILAAYKKIIRALQDEYAIEAIGVGTGGRIDYERGKVLYALANHTDYIGFEIKKELENEFHLPVKVTNDCRAAVIGEKQFGALRDYSDVVGIVLGTGVGGGYLNNNRENEFLSGLGEIGHTVLYPEGRQCSCGQRGCAEQYLSGTALWSIYNEKTGTKLSSGYEFFELIKNHDIVAWKVLDNFKKDLAVFAISCANAFDPEVILIGGGLLDTCKYWWDEFEELYFTMGNERTKEKKLIKAANKNEAAILGAAALVI